MWLSQIEAPTTLLPPTKADRDDIHAGTAAARTRAAALLDLGLYLHHITPFDPETREDEQVVGEAVALAPSRRSYRLLATGFFVCGFHVAFLATHEIARFKLPERLEVVTQFPLSPVGKILKRELRDAIAARLDAEAGV